MKTDHLHVDCSKKWRDGIRSSKRHRKSDVRRAVARLVAGTSDRSDGRDSFRTTVTAWGHCRCHQWLSKS
jgi:hypothetical protein